MLISKQWHCSVSFSMCRTASNQYIRSPCIVRDCLHKLCQRNGYCAKHTFTILCNCHGECWLIASWDCWRTLHVQSARNVRVSFFVSVLAAFCAWDLLPLQCIGIIHCNYMRSIAHGQFDGGLVSSHFCHGWFVWYWEYLPLFSSLYMASVCASMYVCMYVFIAKALFG